MSRFPEIPQLDPTENNNLAMLNEAHRQGLAEASQRGLTGLAAYSHAYGRVKQEAENLELALK